MNDGPLGDRGRALEEQFIRAEEAILIENMRARSQARETKESLAKACGVRDDAVVSTLLSAGITAETAAALGIVPLIAVAWASGEVEEKERAAVLKAAETAGVGQGTAGHELLASWLGHKPDEALFTAWEAFTRHVVSTLTPAQGESVRSDVAGRARKVAEAAGGFLGIGKVSPEETAVLDRIEKAFG
jgi:hypothetical protein